MNIPWILQTRFSEISISKRLGRVFVLKRVAKVFEVLTFRPRKAYGVFQLQLMLSNF